MAQSFGTMGKNASGPRRTSRRVSRQLGREILLSTLAFVTGLLFFLWWIYVE